MVARLRLSSESISWEDLGGMGWDHGMGWGAQDSPSSSFLLNDNTFCRMPCCWLVLVLGCGVALVLGCVVGAGCPSA